MINILVTVIGIGLIGLIYWFFFGKKEEPMETKTSWQITVSGGYQPAIIRVPSGKQSTLTFTRTDPSGCLEEIVIEDFRIREFLPLHVPVAVTVSPSKPGAVTMHCGMNMIRGTIEAV